MDCTFCKSFMCSLKEFGGTVVLRGGGAHRNLVSSTELMMSFRRRANARNVSFCMCRDNRIVGCINP